MRTIYFNVADAYIAVGATISHVYAYISCFNRGDAGLGYRCRIVGIGAYCGPCLAIEASLYGKVAVVESWFQTTCLSVTYYIAAYLVSLFKV